MLMILVFVFSKLTVQSNLTIIDSDVMAFCFMLYNLPFLISQRWMCQTKLASNHLLNFLLERGNSSYCCKNLVEALYV